MWWIELGSWLATIAPARLRWHRPSGPVRFGATLAGQSTVEYALVGALVVIAAAGALTVLGTELTSVFTSISNTLKAAAAAH
jgi:Flp pilus assembly pilin Flp